MFYITVLRRPLLALGTLLSDRSNWGMGVLNYAVNGGHVRWAMAQPQRKPPELLPRTVISYRQKNGTMLYTLMFENNDLRL